MTNKPSSDERLVRIIKANGYQGAKGLDGLEASRMLLERLTPRCIRIARSFGNNEDEAECIASEVISHILRNLGKFEGLRKGSFKAYVVRILINDCIKRRKKRLTKEKSLRCESFNVFDTPDQQKGQTSEKERAPEVDKRLHAQFLNEPVERAAGERRRESMEALCDVTTFNNSGNRARYAPVVYQYAVKLHYVDECSTEKTRELLVREGMLEAEIKVGQVSSIIETGVRRLAKRLQERGFEVPNR